MHIAAVLGIEDHLFPAMDKLTETFRRLEKENDDVVKSGRTHLQDATPIKFSQEISGWRNMLETVSYTHLSPSPRLIATPMNSCRRPDRP